MASFFNNGTSGQAVAFGQRLARSEKFVALYDAGMGLVEETTEYLGEAGKSASAELSREASLIYTTESMRLTTRLMQIASWLLLQRAINEGEMPTEQGVEEKAKIRMQPVNLDMSGAAWADVPEKLKQLIGRSLDIQAKVNRFNEIISGVAAHQPAGATVEQQIASLRRAFTPE